MESYRTKVIWSLNIINSDLTLDCSLFKISLMYNFVLLREGFEEKYYRHDDEMKSPSDISEKQDWNNTTDN